MAVLSQHTLSNSELCVSLREGKQAALSLLYARYAPVLMGLISGMTQSQPAAEEALKETFLKIWTTAHSFDHHKTSLLTWMLRIARESASLSAQASCKQPGLPTPELMDQDSPLKINYPLLTSTEKAILDLVYMKGCSCAEAAAQLQLPAKTITATLRLAVNHLKTTLTV